MELSDKLGYLWALSFLILVLTVAAAILVPIYLEPGEDEWEDMGEEEEGLLNSRYEYVVAAAEDECAVLPSGFTLNG